MIGCRFGVWGPEGTVPQLVSVTIQEVCERLLVLFLSLESPQSDGAGVLTLGSGSVGQVAPLGKDLLSVRVGNVGFDHGTIMPYLRALWGKWWTVPQPSHPLPSDTNPYRQKYNTTNP